METNKYKISVVICTYNRAEFLLGLVESIVQQSFAKEKFEILFINNNSTDDTEYICKSFIQDYPEYSIRYLVESQQGLSYARNRGIKEARGEYITFADDDALLANDFLEKVCDYLDQHPDIAEVGGPIFLKYLTQIPVWANPYMDSLFGYFYPSKTAYYIVRKAPTYPRGSNMTFRIEAFKKCGNFNTSLGRVKRILIGGEEKDIAYRILDAKLKIAYIPDAIVLHLVPETRTTKEFVREQALGIGISEQIRSKANHEYAKRLLIECIKWGATLILWLKYTLYFQYPKGQMLVLFRYWISQGLIKNTKPNKQD